VAALDASKHKDLAVLMTTSAAIPRHSGKGIRNMNVAKKVLQLERFPLASLLFFLL
jgi:hypothetical protein